MRFYIHTVLCVAAFFVGVAVNLSPDGTRSGLIKEPVRPAPGSKDDPYGAARFRYEMIAGTKQFIDPFSRQRAIEQTRGVLQKSDLPMNVNAPAGWSAVGPGNIGGRIRSIIVRPSNSNHLLIGSVSGGIWKTTDGGTSWSAKIDNSDPLAIGCMVNTGDTVYAGTGEGWFNYDAVYGGGIYKSTDFGETWTLLSSTVGASIWNFRNVLQMAIGPTGDVFAVTKAYNYKHGVGDYYTNGGLYRSTNGGTSWTKLSTTGVTNYYYGTDVVPITSSIILFSTYEGGIYRTTNGGSSWTKIVSSLPASGFQRIAMARDPATSSPNTIVYAVFQSTDNTTGGDAGLKGIYKSTDDGVTWSALTKPPNLVSTGNMSYLRNQGWYDNVIAVDPFNSSNIYVGGVDMMKSTNGGSSWSQLTYWHTYYGTPYVHADHHAIVFDPNSSGAVYSGNDGGIYKTTNGGTSWVDLNNGLEITQYYGGAVSNTGATYYGGTQDNGHLSYDGSLTDWSEEVGGDGGYAAVDQVSSTTAYGEYVYLDFYQTTNGGTTWNDKQSGLTDATVDALFIAPFSMNPENSNVIIAGSDNVWITSDGAENWTASSDSLDPYVSAVTVVGSSANYLGFAGTTAGRIFKCTSLNPSSGIDTWSDISPGGHNGAWVRRITVDLNDKQKIYACYSGYNNDGVSPTKHVWYSSNQGTSWSDISGNLPDVPVHSLIIDPAQSQTLYIGTETGVYVTTNRGGTWSTMTTGMPDYAPVDELVLQTGTSKLFAFTHGRSVFEMSLAFIFSVSADTLSFGDLPVDSVDTMMVTVYNNGTGNLGITSIVSTEATFSVYPSTDTIPSLDSAGFAVIFSPDSVRDETGYIIFNHNLASSPDTVRVNGTGVVPITILKLRDTDGDTATSGDRVQKAWGLRLYRDSVSGGTLLASANTESLSVFVSDTGRYIAVEADSGAFWQRINGNGTRYDTVFVDQAEVADTFVNLHVNSFTIRKFWDADGSLATTDDLVPKVWFIEMYEDSLGGPLFSSGHDSVIVFNGVPDGTYMVSEADSADWSFLGYIRNDTLVVDTTLPVMVTVSGGGDVTLDLLNRPPQISLFSSATAELDFGEVGVGVEKIDSVLVENGGYVDLLIDSAVTDNPDFGPYYIFDTIPAFGSKFYVVSFLPSGLGLASGNLVFHHNGSSSPDTISLVGTGTTTHTSQFAGGWNIVSLPVAVNDSQKTTLFPDAVTDAWHYSGGSYTAESTLSVGKGYFMKFPGSSSVGIPGSPVLLDTIDVDEGWNLVGSIADTVPVGNITSIPGGITTSPFYGFSGSLYVASSIIPGHGYWIKSAQAGKLVLSSSPASIPANRIIMTMLSARPPAPPDQIASETSPGNPTSFALYDNYPNPFNSSTHVTFALPEPCHVVIRVFDVLGQEMAVLVSENKEAGVHVVGWNAEGAASGLYFYRMVAGDFAEMKTMILLK